MLCQVRTNPTASHSERWSSWNGYSAILLTAGGQFPLRADAREMTPNGRSWQVLTWSWACSTGHPASDQVLETAANAAWPYALLCAWTFLNDQDAAPDLMDHAVQIASDYVARHPDASSRKLTSRIKSEIKRRAKQLAAVRKYEHSYGLSLDLEAFCASESDIEQRIYANEMFARLSPFAQLVVNRRWLGYTWREIGRSVEMDPTEVRNAYFLELESLLKNLAPPGDSPKCV